MDHAKRIAVVNGDVELGPARWKVLLALPLIGMYLWWATSTIMSGGNIMWLWDFLTK